MKKWDDISEYQVICHAPGKNDRSAMPLGNGETAVSVWMGEDGILRFYLSRSDAVTELERTVKLGMVEIELIPCFCETDSFSQILDVKNGVLTLDNGRGVLKVWVDADDDVVYVEGRFDAPVTVRAGYYTWRSREKRTPLSPSFSSGAVETADKIDREDSCILFYHQNGENGLKYLAALQGITQVDALPDAVSDRIFGGVLGLEGGHLETVHPETGHLETGHPKEQVLVREKTRQFVVKTVTLSCQTKDEERWRRQAFARLEEAADAVDSRQRTEDHWQAFWKKSYIFVREDLKGQDQSAVTRAYLLTRFMTACCKDGAFPILYNGMLFNLCPGGGRHYAQDFVGAFMEPPINCRPDLDCNPDERSWYSEHLWQNLRLPYYAMLSAGDFESLKKMFGFYKRFFKLNRIRADRYYGAQGQHNGEMTLLCGLQSEQIYGTDREGKPDGWSRNRWGGSVEISPGLELLKLMLEYELYTQEEGFTETEIIPYAIDLFRYIETRFKERRDGKIVIGPLNCLETYFDTVNPAPVVAGMHSVLGDLLKLEGLGDAKEYFEHVLLMLPDIPAGICGGKKVLLPAAEYEEERKNVEAPELYAIYPFRLLGKYLGDEKLAEDTFQHAMETGGQMRPYTLGDAPGEPSYSGWQYVGNVAAMLGLRETCREILENNCALCNPRASYPAMWGPVYDAMPDTDHGANIMNLLQLMVLQCCGKKIILLPALPLDWDVKFRLAAPYRTVVECCYEKGKLQEYHTFPEGRREDVILGWKL